MQIHGMSCSHDIPLDEMQYNILCYLVIGDCYCYACSSKALPIGSRSCIVLCTDMSKCFPSATDMSIVFLCHILDDITTNQKLTIQKISALATALARGHYTPFLCACQCKMR